MKRATPLDDNKTFSSSESRKTKLSKNETFIFLKLLCSDELGLIIDFLHVGEILMLSLSCKNMYNFIRHVVKEKYPFLIECMNHKHEKNSKKLKHGYWKNKFTDQLNSVTSEWSLTSVLRSATRLTITPETVENIYEILQNASDIIWNQYFPKRLKFVNVEAQRVRNVLNIQVNVPHHLKIVKSMSIDVQQCPLGFLITNLKLQFETLKQHRDVFKIMSQCIFLETLEVKILHIEEETNASYSNEESVPIFESLKTIIVNFDYDIGDEILVNILKQCPNLEHLEKLHGSSLDDDLLLKVAQVCPKLKQFIVRGRDEHSTSIENEITDNGLYSFLKKMPNLEHVDIDLCCCISGQVFKKIGQFQQLKYFRIERGRDNASLIEQCEDIHFGGGTLPKLEFLDVGSMYSFNNHAPESELDYFVKSLKTLAPNLKDFGELLMIENIDMKKVLTLFSLSSTLRMLYSGWSCTTHTFNDYVLLLLTMMIQQRMCLSFTMSG